MVERDVGNKDAAQADQENTQETIAEEIERLAHPSHYTNDGCSVIEPRHFTRKCLQNDFNFGNICKYTIRAGRKTPDKEREDLIKAAVYCQFALDDIEGEKDSRGDLWRVLFDRCAPYHFADAVEFLDCYPYLSVNKRSIIFTLTEAANADTLARRREMLKLVRKFLMSSIEGVSV